MHSFLKSYRAELGIIATMQTDDGSFFCNPLLQVFQTLAYPVPPLAAMRRHGSALFFKRWICLEFDWGFGVLLNLEGNAELAAVVELACQGAIVDA
jgi:hypothetical protein